jgi:hypothetical protein
MNSSVGSFGADAAAVALVAAAFVEAGLPPSCAQPAPAAITANTAATAVALSMCRSCQKAF